MIYDYREYTFKPGKVPEYMAAVEELSIGIRAKYGIKLAGWYYADIGELNRVVHHLGVPRLRPFRGSQGPGRQRPRLDGQVPTQDPRFNRVPKDLSDALPRLRAAAGVGGT